MHKKTSNTQPHKLHTPSRVCSTMKLGWGDFTPGSGAVGVLLAKKNWRISRRTARTKAGRE